MSSRFVYEAEDAKGCTVQSPDFSECRDCQFNCEQTPIRCLAYEKMKPSSVIYDKKACDRKRMGASWRKF